MRLAILIAFWLFSLFYPAKISAIYDPLSVPNNKFGIHIIDENDLENAASLVNSSKGKWGYVTMVIPENERKVDKWQNIFEKLKRLKLIPIIRLATSLHFDTWQKPSLKEIEPWVDFLSRLKWVTKNRYIILFNEANHAKENGGMINPAEYAEIVVAYSSALKKKSEDFFILPAGLDAAAPNGPETMDEEKFIKEELQHSPNLFDHLDGWVSHSYPNPGFRGKVTDMGRGSLRTYLWEIDLLKNLGVTKKLPVFITETGWPHQEGFPENPNFYKSYQIGKLIKMAAEEIWNDPQIVAITPFILNYQSYPFSHFSWQIPGEKKFYGYFEVYRFLAKIAGSPYLGSIFYDELKLNLSLSCNKDYLDSSQLKKGRPAYLASLFSRLFNL